MKNDLSFSLYSANVSTIDFVGQYFGDKKKRLCRHDIVSNMMYGLGVIISQLL